MSVTISALTFQPLVVTPRKPRTGPRSIFIFALLYERIDEIVLIAANYQILQL
jgi:hypothetical protein